MPPSGPNTGELTGLQKRSSKAPPSASAFPISGVRVGLAARGGKTLPTLHLPVHRNSLPPLSTTSIAPSTARRVKAATEAERLLPLPVGQRPAYAHRGERGRFTWLRV